MKSDVVGLRRCFRTEPSGVDYSQSPPPHTHTPRSLTKTRRLRSSSVGFHLRNCFLHNIKHNRVFSVIYTISYCGFFAEWTSCSYCIHSTPPWGRVLYDIKETLVLSVSSGGLLYCLLQYWPRRLSVADILLRQSTRVRSHFTLVES